MDNPYNLKIGDKLLIYSKIYKGTITDIFINSNSIYSVKVNWYENNYDNIEDEIIYKEVSIVSYTLDELNCCIKEGIIHLIKQNNKSIKEYM